VAGDEARRAGNTDAELRTEHGQRRHRHRHQRRLRILGQHQPVLRPFPHDAGELEAESLVDLVEHGPRRGELLGKGMAHADLLAALAREGERDRHRGFERFPLRDGWDEPRTAWSCQGEW
jgi:hypothetical protein